MAGKAAGDVALVDAPSETDDSTGYVVPVVHVRVPETLVNVGFWGGLAGAVTLGVVDLPLGVLVGAGVVVARHRLNK